jgi:tetratricopeptide (TPR) repeat protein
MKRFLPFFLLLAFVISATLGYCQSKKDYQTIADSLYENKDYKGAIENFTKAINANTKNKIKLAELLDKRGQAENDLELYAEALKDETAAIIANPNFGSAYWNRALAHDGKNNYQLGIDDYTKAVPFYKGNNESLSILYNNIAIDEKKLHQYKKAIEDHTKAIALNGQNGDAYWSRASAHNKNGDYQMAIDDYTTAMFYNQEDIKELSRLYDNRGENKQLLKLYKDAINDFNTALKFNPDNEDAYWDRGLTYQRNGDYELAVNDYTKAMQFYKDDKVNLAILYDNRAQNEMALRHPEKAIEDINSAIALDAKRGHLYWSRASIYTQTGDCKHAVEDYTKTTDFYKDNKKALASLHYNVATNLYILNDNQKVPDECTTAIALNPEFGGSYFLRGKIYLKRLINKEQAVNDFNKAIELDTTKSSVSYIFSQFYIGQTDLAMKLLQQQVLSTPNPDDVLNHYYNIACVFSIMNKPEEANIYLKKAIDSGYSKKFAANDEDFDNIRKTPDYIATMTENKLAK